MLSILSYKRLDGDWNVTVSYRDYRDGTDRLARFTLEGSEIRSLKALTASLGELLCGLVAKAEDASTLGDGR